MPQATAKKREPRPTGKGCGMNRPEAGHPDFKPTPEVGTSPDNA